MLCTQQSVEMAARPRLQTGSSAALGPAQIGTCRPLLLAHRVGDAGRAGPPCSQRLRASLSPCFGKLKAGFPTFAPCDNPRQTKGLDYLRSLGADTGGLGGGARRASRRPCTCIQPCPSPRSWRAPRGSGQERVPYAPRSIT